MCGRLLNYQDGQMCKLTKRPGCYGLESCGACLNYLCENAHTYIEDHGELLISDGRAAGPIGDDIKTAVLICAEKSGCLRFEKL